jgi:2-dehydro-3-deoxygluconokinase
MQRRRRQACEAAFQERGVDVTILELNHRSIVGIGEAMVEFAPVGDGLYRRGFAGDTLNTCWHMAQLLGDRRRVGYLTRVGADPYSLQFVEFGESSGLDARRILRDPTRNIGLYVISLAGAERSFTYWRETSAARRLANDRRALDEAIADVGLIHLSGITLAVIGEAGRRNLMAALEVARSRGSIVSFDPNVRLRLWPDAETLRRSTRAMMAVTDIALPSFDDEAQVWRDADPEATAARIGGYGVRETVVKNGAADVTIASGGDIRSIPTAAVSEIRDTTGAGDSFNAGYLAGRVVGMTALQSCEQKVAGEVISHFGALAPKETLAAFRATVHGFIEGRERIGGRS